MTIWDSIYKDYKNGGQAWATLKEDLHPQFIIFIEQSLFGIKNALDVGCGNGKYLIFLAKLGFRTTGIDSSKTAIEMAKKELNNECEFINEDMYSYKFKHSTYDLVLSHATLHHGKKNEVNNLLENIYDSLILNGRIFLSLPDNNCKQNWVIMEEHETLADGTCIPLKGPEKGLPHSFYSKSEIEELFKTKYSNLNINIDNRGRWIITGEKCKA